MSEILITLEPAAPVEIDAVQGRVLTVTSPPEVYVPYIGDNGHWWVAGADSGVAARGEAGANGKNGVDGQPGQDADPAAVAAIADAAQKAQAAAGQAQAAATEAATAAAQSTAAAETASSAANDAAAGTAKAAEATAIAQQAAADAANSAAEASAKAAAAEKTAAEAQAEARAAVEAVNAMAALPVTVSGSAPCLRTGSFAFTRIYFPRRFAAVPDVVPGVRDFSGTWRIASMVGLTTEYVDLITNYWHAGNTFTYIAVGKLAD